MKFDEHILQKPGWLKPPTSITWIWTIWVTIKKWLLRCQVIMTLDRRCRHRVPALVPFEFPTSSPTLGPLGGSNSQRAGFVSFQMGSGNLKKPEGLPGLLLWNRVIWKMKGTFEDFLKKMLTVTSLDSLQMDPNGIYGNNPPVCYLLSTVANCYFWEGFTFRTGIRFETLSYLGCWCSSIHFLQNQVWGDDYFSFWVESLSKNKSRFQDAKKVVSTSREPPTPR